MVGSDLEEDYRWPAGTLDLNELIEGYRSLPDNREVEIIVAFGGANKDGWRGMKFANISQIMADSEDQAYGDETGPSAYLYRADGANMGDESSLKLFLDYLRDGYVNFDRRFLTFWDHGNSYVDFGNDTNFNWDGLSMDEISRAFQHSQAGTFDLIGFDACLMASVEVAKVIEPHAEYMIASEETEPGHGWLWSAVVRSYAQEDDVVDAGKRMVDNFVQNVHGDDTEGKTLSMLDLSEYDRLVAALNPIISVYGQQLRVSDEYSTSLNYGQTNVRSYGEEERDDSRASIDLKHFAQLLAENPPNAQIGSSLNDLMAAIDGFVVHSNHDGTRANSFGVAIDAPENTNPEYSAYKINDTWLDFQKAYEEFRQNDTTPPVLESSAVNVDPQSLQLDFDVPDEWGNGVVVAFEDDDLAEVTSLYGFIQPVEYEDGSVEDYFMVVAELETYPTETEGEYFAQAWDQYWFTLEYDPAEDTAWIPASFTEYFEEDGQPYWVYAAEIYFSRWDKDYSDYYFPADDAVMMLIANEYMEVVDYYIQTYQYIYSGPDDEEGTVQFDKATWRIEPGDVVQFWNYGFNLDDESLDDWFEASDFIEFTQEPVFQLELLAFEDESGQLVEYQQAIWAEDVSGNPVLYGPFDAVLHGADDLLQGPELVDWRTEDDGAVAVFGDQNLIVTTLHGYAQPVEYQDGSVEDYFMVIAELETYPTETEGEYFAPAWDQWSLTVQYDPAEETAWIPISFVETYEEDGQTYWVYAAEVYYSQSGKDYSGYDFPADDALLMLIVNESWEVVDHLIMFGEVAQRIEPGDAVQFWNYGFNQDDMSMFDLFETSDFLTFVQEPVFQLEFFKDVSGQLLEYQFAIRAVDVGGNEFLYGPFPVE